MFRFIMKYDFDRVIDRTRTNSIEWNKHFLKEHFKTDDVLPLWVADMDFQSPQPVIDALKKRTDEEIYGYSWHKIPAYLDSVTNWMKLRHGWEIDNDWIVYSPGIVPAIYMLIQTFVNTGEKVIIQPPVYQPFFTAIENNGRQVLTNQLLYENKKYSIDLRILKKKLEIL